ADADNVESVYNIAYDLFRTPLQPGFLVERVGKPQDEPFVDGDDVSIFYFLSGDPRTVNEDGAPIRMQVMFYPQGRSSDGIVEVGGSVSYGDAPSYSLGVCGLPVSSAHALSNDTGRHGIQKGRADV